MLRLVHAHRDRQVRLVLVKPEGFQLRTEVSQPITTLSHHTVAWNEKGTNKEKLMISFV
jgi:hypothetical protein